MKRGHAKVCSGRRFLTQAAALTSGIVAAPNSMCPHVIGQGRRAYSTVYNCWTDVTCAKAVLAAEEKAPAHSLA
jgi:hypothetical protein